MKAEDVAQEIGEQYQHGYGYVRIGCYNTSFHKNQDRDPSLVIYDGDRGYYCFACGVSGSHEWLMKQYGVETKGMRRGGQVFKKEYKKYDFERIYPTLRLLPEQAQEVMAQKGLKSGMLEAMGWRWHENQIPGWGTGIFIPYYKDGKIVGARLRLLNGNIRFKSLPGGESFPFMMDDIQGKFFVCEGESDTITLTTLGYRAVGIPGATNTQAIKKLVERAAERKARICVIPDNDQAGNDFAARISKHCKDNNIGMDILKVPRGKDVNEWYNIVGEEEFTKYINEGHQKLVI